MPGHAQAIHVLFKEAKYFLLLLRVDLGRQLDFCGIASDAFATVRTHGWKTESALTTGRKAMTDTRYLHTAPVLS
jgi:hypothetical protein